MPKINVDGWAKDKARRSERVAKGTCPMDGQPKRVEDEFCSDACKVAAAQGASSKE